MVAGTKFGERLRNEYFGASQRKLAAGGYDDLSRALIPCDTKVVDGWWMANTDYDTETSREPLF